MQVRNHRIDAIWHGQSSNLSRGTIVPRLIVTHYTTGWSGTASRDWLMGPAGGSGNRASSAHVVIDRDGTTWQIAPFNRRAWHAGPSRFGTLSDLNGHSVGLEFVNPGWLRPAGGGAWVDDYGHRRTAEQLEAFGGFVERPNPRVGSGTLAWPLYTEAQVAAGREIVLALLARYDIAAIVSHEAIDSRGWKTDPGPAFPERAFEELLGESDPAADRLFAVSATRLNIRGGPDVGADRIEPPGGLPLGTRVRALRWSGPWAFAEVAEVAAPAPGLAAGLRGWLHGDYLDRIV